MQASSTIADILPARPAQAPQGRRPGQQDDGFSRALTDARTAPQRQPADNRRTDPPRRDDHKVEAAKPERPERPGPRRTDHDDKAIATENNRRDARDAAEAEKAGSFDSKTAEATKRADDAPASPADGQEDAAKSARDKPQSEPEQAQAAQPVQADAAVPAVTVPALSLQTLTINAPVAVALDGSGSSPEQAVAEAQDPAAAAATVPTQANPAVILPVSIAAVTEADPTQLQTAASGSAAPVASPPSALAATGGEPQAEGAAKPAPRPEAAQTFAATLTAQAAPRADVPVADGGKLAPDMVQATASPQAAVASSPTAAPVTPQQAMAQADAPVPLQALAVEIGMRAMRGAKEFQIRLDPEDLGRVDIRLEISEKGEVQAKLTVERVETLHLLQRDARTLERAFDQAGLKTNPDALQFSLSDSGRQGQQAGRDSDNRAGRARADDILPEDVSAATSAIYRAPGPGALDIRI